MTLVTKKKTVYLAWDAYGRECVGFNAADPDAKRDAEHAAGIRLSNPVSSLAYDFRENCQHYGKGYRKGFITLHTFDVQDVE